MSCAREEETALNQTISPKDRERLRDLARHQAELANKPEMLRLHDEWREHNAFQGKRPMVHLELWTFGQEVLPQRMLCEGEEARRIEQSLLRNTLNHELFADDHPILPYYGVGWRTHFVPFGIHVEQKHNLDDKGRSVGFEYESEVKIEDLEADYSKLKKSEYGVDRAGTLAEVERLNDLFGDILPVRLTGRCLGASPTQWLVKFMTMENMFFAMLDYPELFLQMMDRLADDMLEYFAFLEKEKLLLPTTGPEHLGQGTWCYTNELPDTARTSKDVWGYADSQETVGVRPKQFEELIFPAYKRIVSAYGLLSYGCCEPVDPIWESCLSKLDNLRKLSISPWCDEEFMGERLRGRKTIFHRKPSPNYLGVGAALDEDALRKSLKKTLAAAQGCTLEITQRDVYTINNDEAKARRYVQIIREEIDAHWKP